MDTSKPVLLVADRVKKHMSRSLEERSLEALDTDYFQNIQETINRLGRTFDHIDSPEELIQNIDSFRDHTIVSLWSGKKSRSRRALVAAICESAMLNYIGADSYTAIICQDKMLSKDFSRRFGLYSPDAVQFNSTDTLPQYCPVELPVVVKPVYEGGSIGINKKSLCRTWREAVKQIQRLFEALGGPIMVECFVEGEEVSVCMLGQSGCRPRYNVALKFDVENFDISRSIWSMELKKTDNHSRIDSIVTEDLPSEVIENVGELFASFEKVDFMRVDGRMKNGIFHLIELSPDVNLSSQGLFFKAMNSIGLDYASMWSELLELYKY